MDRHGRRCRPQTGEPQRLVFALHALLAFQFEFGRRVHGVVADRHFAGARIASDDDAGVAEAAVRELTEETGAISFIMEPVSYYCVDTGNGRQYGRLFLAEVDQMGKHTDTDEIEEVRIFRRLPKNLSLQDVMSFLYRVARQHDKGLKV